MALSSQSGLPFPSSTNLDQSLSDAIAALISARPDLPLEPADAPHLPTLATALKRHAHNWLDTIAAGTAADRKTAAALLADALSTQLGDVLVELYITGAPLPRLTATSIGLAATMRAEPGEPAIDLTFQILTNASGRPFDRARFRRSILDTFSPVVGALTRHAGLPATAVWSLVTDGVASAFLRFGHRHDVVQRACNEAVELLSSQPTPLQNSRWRFSQDDSGHTTYVRGGCCAATAPPAETTAPAAPPPN